MSLQARLMPLLTTLGVAAAAAAAQLGIAYGFAVLLWAKDFSDPSGAAWAANLTWVCWLAATSVVLGAIVGGHITRTAGFPDSPVTQAIVTVTAGLGALISVPLSAIPSAYAELAGDPNPATTVSRMALVGVVLGAIVAFGVLVGRPVAWNVIANSVWLWLVALISVLFALRGASVPDTTRLAQWGSGEPSWFSTLLPMLLTMLLIGAAVAYVAKRREHSRVSVAVSGAAGPLLVGVAYLVAGPGSQPEAGDQFLPYLAAPYGVVAGLLGSLLVAAIERPEGAEPAARESGAASSSSRLASEPPDSAEAGVRGAGAPGAAPGRPADGADHTVAESFEFPADQWVGGVGSPAGAASPDRMVAPDASSRRGDATRAMRAIPGARDASRTAETPGRPVRSPEPSVRADEATRALGVAPWAADDTRSADPVRGYDATRTLDVAWTLDATPRARDVSRAGDTTWSTDALSADARSTDAWSTDALSADATRAMEALRHSDESTQAEPTRALPVADTRAGAEPDTSRYRAAADPASPAVDSAPPAADTTPVPGHAGSEEATPGRAVSEGAAPSRADSGRGTTEDVPPGPVESGPADAERPDSERAESGRAAKHALPDLAPGERQEWEDDERWLEQIKADRPTPRPSPRPDPGRVSRSDSGERRRRWTLFDDDEDTGSG